ncbi:MAG: hypothetical protein SFV17_21570 [Candidatus Obscuribacter sp.]|nr:hypothetical protein [Candidatus Obscuribacter sp.]
MRRFCRYLKMLTLVLVSGQCIAPALAGDFDEGVKLYQASNFRGALPYFEKAARDFPTSWQVRFYLGHTYFALGKMTAARSQYEYVQNSGADAAAKSQAEDALNKVCKYLGVAAPAPLASSGAAGAAGKPGAGATPAARAGSAGKGKSDAEEDDDDDEQEPGGNDDRSKRLQALKESIRRVALEEVAKIKQEAKEKLEHEKRQANQFWVYSDGSMGVDIEPERKTELEKECTQRCKQVMDEAERRIKNLK